MSKRLVEPLSAEDCNLQAIPETSPAKWHLAHTTWFFETFFLSRNPRYKPFHSTFEQLFNSYYLTVGQPPVRRNRSLLSRPSLQEVLRYRDYVDEQVDKLMREAVLDDEAEMILWTGIHHEEQHQELLLTDIKYNLFQNPLKGVYTSLNKPILNNEPVQEEMMTYPESIVRIGAENSSFCYDNELPVHRRFLEPFQISNRLVTNAEYLDFIEDGGYEKFDYWLSDGWDFIQSRNIRAPLYWIKQGSEYMLYTATGIIPLPLNVPVCHVSFYEAAAYAAYRGYRLPTEFEWEHVARKIASDWREEDFQEHGNFLESWALHPTQKSRHDFFGNVWEWTSSHYEPYPGYKSAQGALGEYNGKFMNNQRVLRGGSCYTSARHIRPSYRNFFHADARWQMTGIRLAHSLTKETHL